MQRQLSSLSLGQLWELLSSQSNEMQFSCKQWGIGLYFFPKAYLHTSPPLYACSICLDQWHNPCLSGNCSYLLTRAHSAGKEMKSCTSLLPTTHLGSALPSTDRPIQLTPPFSYMTCLPEIAWSEIQWLRSSLCFYCLHRLLRQKP